MTHAEDLLAEGKKRAEQGAKTCQNSRTAVCLPHPCRSVFRQISWIPPRTYPVTAQSAYRWRPAFGGLKISQVKGRKELETGNARLDVWVMERSNLLARDYWRHMRCWFGGGQGFLPAFRQASNVMMGMVTSMQPLVNMPATSATSRILKTGFMAGWLSSYIYRILGVLFYTNRARCPSSADGFAGVSRYGIGRPWMAQPPG